MKAATELSSNADAAARIGIHESTLSKKLTEIEESEASDEDIEKIAQGLGFSQEQFLELIENPKIGKSLESLREQVATGFQDQTINEISALKKIFESIGNGDKLNIITTKYPRGVEDR